MTDTHKKLNKRLNQMPAGAPRKRAVLLIAMMGCFWAAFFSFNTTMAFAATTSTSSTSSSDVQDEICADFKEAFIQSMQSGATARVALNHNVLGNAAPGDADEVYCIGNIKLAFSLTDFLLDRLNLYATLVKALIKSIMEQACRYVQISIDNALSILCLPIPDFDMFDVNLEMPDAESCNDGISLVTYNPGGTDPDLDYKKFSDFFKENEL